MLSRFKPFLAIRTGKRLIPYVDLWYNGPNGRIRLSQFSNPPLFRTPFWHQEDDHGRHK